AALARGARGPYARGAGGGVQARCGGDFRGGARGCARGLNVQRSLAQSRALATHPRGQAVKTWDYLFNPIYGNDFWPPIVTGLAVAALCALLSVLVVLKRLAFIGQGISHAAFGGIGVAGVLGLVGAALTPAQSAGQFFVVLTFCL